MLFKALKKSNHFSYKVWLSSASISLTNYSSLDDVLADELAVRKLMTIHAAVDYLASWQTTDTNIIKILNNDLCAKWITLRDYALDTLDKEYRSLMESLGKYYYGEWALMPQVPKMTSNTASYGEVIASSEQSANPAYYAFDGSLDTLWVPNTVVPVYCGYKFTNPVCVKKVSITHHNLTVITREISHGKIQGSNDGSTWIDIIDDFSAPSDEKGLTYFVDCSGNNNNYLYYRVYVSAVGSGDNNRPYIASIQFYAWAPKGNVPIMTSNTAPYGTAIATSEHTTASRYAWNAFDGNDNGGWNPTSGTLTNAYVGYHFTNPVIVRKVAILPDNTAAFDRVKDFEVKASNDGSTWTTLYTGTAQSTTSAQKQYFEINNDTPYLYYIVNVLNVYSTATVIGIRTLQFYGRELKVSVPTMTSNTAPYGEVTTDATSSGVQPYVYTAFDNDFSQTLGLGATEACVGYDFKTPTVIKSYFIWGNQISDARLEASNDGNTYESINTYTNDLIVHVDNNTAYRYYRLRMRYSGGNVKIFELQFYGLNYSEYDWDTVNPRHYLYDHGVELETLEQMSAANGWSTAGKTANVNSQKLPYALYIAPTSIGYYDGFSVDHIIDLTSYNLMRFVADTNGSDGQDSNIFFSACSSKTNWETPNRIANIYFYGAPAGSLSLSGVNQSAYAVTNSINRSKGWGYVYEWWLE